MVQVHKGPIDLQALAGVAILVTVLGINLLGDGLRDLFGARSA